VTTPVPPADGEGRPPVVRVSDADREVVVARLRTALSEGRLDVGEFAERAHAAYAAATRGDLDALVDDLPSAAAVEIVGTRTPEQLTSVFGDIRLAGPTAPAEARTVFGDIRLDLRDLRTDAERVELTLTTWFGDVDVVVAEGVAAELIGSTVFGDRVTDLAAVPRLAGTPRVVVHARTVFGDLRLRSLAPGESASRFRALLDRLAGRTQPPPGPSPPVTPPPLD
jgi:Domain of unknown function (DUF1707)